MEKLTRNIVSPIPLRYVYDYLTDYEFDVVVAGLSNKELELLKMVYGENYDAFYVIKLNEFEAKTLKKILDNKVAKRVEIVKSSRFRTYNKTNEDERVKAMVPKMNIYGYFHGYSVAAVKKSILTLEANDYQKVMGLCHNNLNGPLEMSKTNKEYFFLNLYPKIIRRLNNSTEYLIKNVSEISSHLLGVETKRGILAFLSSDVYQEQLRLFEPNEAVCYAMNYGLINNIRYGAASISIALDMEEDEVITLLQAIHKKLCSLATPVESAAPSANSFSLKRTKN